MVTTITYAALSQLQITQQNISRLLYCLEMFSLTSHQITDKIKIMDRQMSNSSIYIGRMLVS